MSGRPHKCTGGGCTILGAIDLPPSATLPRPDFPASLPKRASSCSSSASMSAFSSATVLGFLSLARSRRSDLTGGLDGRGPLTYYCAAGHQPLVGHLLSPLFFQFVWHSEFARWRVLFAAGFAPCSAGPHGAALPNPPLAAREPSRGTLSVHSATHREGAEGAQRAKPTLMRPQPSEG